MLDGSGSNGLSDVRWTLYPLTKQQLRNTAAASPRVPASAWSIAVRASSHWSIVVVYIVSAALFATKTGSLSAEASYWSTVLLFVHMKDCGTSKVDASSIFRSKCAASMAAGNFSLVGVIGFTGAPRCLPATNNKCAWVLTLSSKEAHSAEDVLGAVTKHLQLNFFYCASK